MKGFGVFVAFVLVVAIGCSPMLEVSQKYDDTIHFDRFKTYDWARSEVPGEFRDTKKLLDLDSLITAVVDSKMVTLGFTRDSVNPDILVAYHLGVHDQVFVSDYGMHYYQKTGWSETETVQDGMLIIDFVLNGTTDRVWQGTGYGAMNVDPTPDMVKKNVERAIEKIFKQYPPPPPVEH